MILGRMMCKCIYRFFFPTRSRYGCTLFVLRKLVGVSIVIIALYSWLPAIQLSGIFDSRLSKNLSSLDFRCEKNNVLGLPFYVAEQCKNMQPEVADTYRAHCKLLTCRNLVNGPVVSSNGTKEADLQQLVSDFSNAFPYQHHPSDFEVAAAASDCKRYRKLNGFDDVPVVLDAVDFPLAYSMIVHRDAHQVSRLFRAIYRPQNTYCIHVDAKSRDHFRTAIKTIAMCFNNVHLANRSESIVYAGFSRLQADINCMKDHLNTPSNTPGARWRYLINTAGQAFPLRTNEEIVSILRLYNGTNDIEGLSNDRVLSERFVNRWVEAPNAHVVDDSDDTERLKPVMTGEMNPPPPHGLRIVKGSAYGAFSRQFVQFVVENKMARDLLDWSRFTYSPDEFYWATLHHTHVNPQLNTPGGFPGNPVKKRWLSVYVEWVSSFSLWTSACRGRPVRQMCVFGVEDLPYLVRRPELFANKFFADYEPLAVDCLEAWLRYKETCDVTNLFLDLNNYRQLVAPLFVVNVTGSTSFPQHDYANSKNSK